MTHLKRKKPGLEQLKSCSNRSDIATLLRYKPAKMTYILYKMPESDKYDPFKITKKTGGIRKICAPLPKLKLLQKRLSDVLQNCIEDINKERGINKKSLSHGFKRGYSIVTNARIHKNRRYVMNLDLENFFEAFNFGRVRGFFIKNNHFKLNDKVATTIAQIACFNNALPQGSPASPVMTNLIAHILDMHLVQLARKYRCRYSRYADDITFSTLKQFPPEIAKLEMGYAWVVGHALESQINKCGFQINHKKTRVQYKQSRQDVTGVIVNKKLNARPEYWRTARAMADHLFKKGEFFIKKQVPGENGTLTVEEKKGTIAQLGGILSFINTIDKDNKKNTKASNQKEALNSRETTYKNFLFLRHFFHAEKPVVICEGKTDYIYLRGAMRYFADKHPGQFPALCSKDGKGTHTFQIHFYRSKKDTDHLLGLSGGTGNLNNFISKYEKQCKNYKIPVSKNPVLVLTDNDQGVEDLFSTVNKAGDFPEKITEDKPFYFICENLYFVPIPKKDNKNTSIEDYFDEKTLALKVNGKTFCLLHGKTDKAGKINKDEYYTKSVFASGVVLKHEKTIDFSGFQIILENLTKAIEHYNNNYTKINEPEAKP